MPAAKPITPLMRFGRLTILREIEPHRVRSGATRRRFECRCDCGTIKPIQLAALVNGLTVSCGCFAREKLGALRRSHGHTTGRGRTKVFQAWISMRGRCNNPNNKRYADYGGRGIRVCDQWNQSFEKFLADMGEPPSPRHSLDRYPNNDGNYEPGNCRWATTKEQLENKRKPRRRVTQSK